MTSQAGLKVLIHHQQTPPMVEELGFSLSPGTSTLAAIRKEKVQISNNLILKVRF